jgi:hypothetical protein
VDLTTFAALSAAVLGVVNLAVTTYSAGRRERLKWAREALAEAFYAFVNDSYHARGAAGNYQRAVYRGDASTEELEDLLRVVEEQRHKLRDAQTRVRLLAPAKTLNKAQAVRDTITQMVKALGPELDEDEFNVHRRRVAEVREDFISSAKRDMALRR